MATRAIKNQESGKSGQGFVTGYTCDVLMTEVLVNFYQLPIRAERRRANGAGETP